MRPLLQELGKGRRAIEIRDESRSPILEAPQRPKMRTADAGCILQHCLEHRFQLAGRSADYLKYLCGRRLLLEGLAQFVEEARVLDGDDCLGRKALYQFNL